MSIGLTFQQNLICGCRSLPSLQKSRTQLLMDSLLVSFLSCCNDTGGFDTDNYDPLGAEKRMF
jgi:hypothetical protein